eukprot:143075-Prorocentrum_minimum.AAC.1
MHPRRLLREATSPRVAMEGPRLGVEAAALLRAALLPGGFGIRPPRARRRTCADERFSMSRRERPTSAALSALRSPQPALERSGSGVAAW